LSDLCEVRCTRYEYGALERLLSFGKTGAAINLHIRLYPETGLYLETEGRLDKVFVCQGLHCLDSINTLRTGRGHLNCLNARYRGF